LSSSNVFPSSSLPLSLFLAANTVTYAHTIFLRFSTCGFKNYSPPSSSAPPPTPPRDFVVVSFFLVFFLCFFLEEILQISGIIVGVCCVRVMCGDEQPDMTLLVDVIVILGVVAEQPLRQEIHRIFRLAVAHLNEPFRQDGDDLLH
jgi:hypothetical protein